MLDRLGHQAAEQRLTVLQNHHPLAQAVDEGHIVLD
ncbi:Uncharacterised protein [Klebsiella pneumoniae]|nr:Uncharacterised protein [Klebsiella pneumoniae]